MSWYWIVLIGFVYIAGWGASSAIGKNECDDPVSGAALGMFWPLILPFYIGWKIFSKKNNRA